MSSRNRRAGHAFELRVISWIKHIFPRAVSARAESRNLDAKKVDIAFTGDYAIQCKITSNVPQVHKLMDEMPDGKVPIIVWQRTRRANTNMVSTGPAMAILPMQDLISLMEDAYYNAETGESSADQ